jgi:hypothetical protein
MTPEHLTPEARLRHFEDWARVYRDTLAGLGRPDASLALLIEQAEADARHLRRLIDLEAEVVRLREALAGLVRICEEHDAGIADVIGKPPGWKDAYLDAARAALQRAEGGGTL